MQFIDTHLHLQDFKTAFAPLLLPTSPLVQAVVVTAQVADFKPVEALKKQYPERLSVAYGIHPWYVNEQTDFSTVERCLQADKTALVGEIGVDELKAPVSAAQRYGFAAQLELAEKYNRPVIVHAAKAFTALKDFSAPLQRVKFCHHGFVKNEALLRFILKCNGYIGLGTLFAKQPQLPRLWSMMPKDKILLESDAPYRVAEDGYSERMCSLLTQLSERTATPLEILQQQLIKNAKDFMSC
jgi:TatD DNase family protein